MAAGLAETEEVIQSIRVCLDVHRSETVGVAARVTQDADMRCKIDAEFERVFQRSYARLEQVAKSLRATGHAGPVDLVED